MRVQLTAKYFLVITLLMLVLIIDIANNIASSFPTGEVRRKRKISQDDELDPVSNSATLTEHTKKSIRKRSSKGSSKSKSKDHHKEHSSKNDPGIQIKLARKKGSNEPHNPPGTIVKIPSINKLSEYDAILIDILGDSNSKSATSSELVGRSNALEILNMNNNEEDTVEQTTIPTTTTTISTTSTTTHQAEELDGSDSPVYVKAKSDGIRNQSASTTGSKSSGILPQENSNKGAYEAEKNIKLVEGKQPEVKTKLGVYYRGKIINVNGKEVYAFYGIPYAAPPIGKFRFKRPFPPTVLPENTVYEASKIHAPCFSTRRGQTSVSAAFTKNNYVEGMDHNSKEDCLYLNIWLPASTLNEKELAPVLVWIHGEGFLSGLDNEDYQSAAAFVAETNIVLINIQYRLGVFGFLHMGTGDAPGNMGLLDQIQALQWIDENCESFGANPRAITIMGHDAGAGFVGIHLISKISPSFFKRAIMLGGAPTQPHTFKSSYEAKMVGLNFAKELGCVNTESVKSIVECLRRADADTLWDIQLLFHSNPLSFPFVPTEDDYVIDDNPLYLLGNGKGKVCQVLIGGTSNEGSAALAQLVENISVDRPTFISYDKFLRVMSHIFGMFEDLEFDAILHQYKNWKNPEDGFINQLRIADAIGDHFVTCPLRKFSDAWSGRGLNTYHFSFSEKLSVLNRSDWMGSVHGDEIDFFFGVALHHPDKFTPDEVELSRQMLNVLADFVRTGNPGWDRYGYETPNYFNFSTSLLSNATSGLYGPRAEQCGFWNEFFPKLKAVIPAVIGHPKMDSKFSYSVDEHCIVSLDNCTKSNLAIYVNGIKK